MPDQERVTRALQRLLGPEGATRAALDEAAAAICGSQTTVEAAAASLRDPRAGG